MRIGRSPAMMAMIAAMVLPCGGCGLMPHPFRKMQPPEATERARAIGKAPREADPQVVPALVNRLEDEDPVVRMAASEELRKRTGRDFGFVAWASPEERAAAIARWRGWLKAPPMPAAEARPPEILPVAADSSRAARRQARRRRKTQPPPSTAAAPPKSPEDAPS